MLRLRMMRAPQKYVQGKNSLLQFHKEMTSLGDKWLFICSRSGYKMTHDKIEKALKELLMYVSMKFSAEFPAPVKSRKCGKSYETII